MVSLHTETAKFKWVGHKNEFCFLRNTLGFSVLFEKQCKWVLLVLNIKRFDGYIELMKKNRNWTFKWVQNIWLQHNQMIFNKVLFHHSWISDCFLSYSDLSCECSKERCARAVLSVNLDIWTNLETAGCYLHFPQSNSAPNKNYCELGKISLLWSTMIRGCS